MRAGVIRVGTRASRLARAQAASIVELLTAAVPRGTQILTEVVTTEGDLDHTTPLPHLGGTGVFTDALEQALRVGTIDVAVHSLKDLPVASAQDVVVAAICGREDVRDVLVARDGSTLVALPPGARVGTCSTRRAAQLRTLRPDLVIADVRGNVDTRVSRVAAGDYDAIVLAAAGLHRLRMHAAISQYLPLDRFLPAPGQGALAVQCRTNDADSRHVLGALDDLQVRAATTAERAFLAALGGGCAAPVAAFAESRGVRLVMRGLVASAGGTACVHVEGSGDVDAPEALGRSLAAEAIAGGAGQLLQSCTA